MIDYHVDLQRQIITTRVIGRVTFTDVADHLQRILRDPKFNPALNALIVATDVAAVPSPASVSLLKPLVKAWSFQRSGARWAFVLPTADTKNFVESALVDLKLTTVTTRCFLSESAALGWLESMAAPVSSGSI